MRRSPTRRCRSSLPMPGAGRAKRSPTVCARSARRLCRPASAYQLAGSLGLPPWKVERAQRQARGWTPDALVDAMRVAAECNAAVKGGTDDRGYALERAVFGVVAARAAGGAR